MVSKNVKMDRFYAIFRNFAEGFQVPKLPVVYYVKKILQSLIITSFFFFFFFFFFKEGYYTWKKTRSE